MGFLFDLFCTVPEPDDDGTFRQRRPELNTLYDVFINVRDDEREHWKTLCNLVQYDTMKGVGQKVISTEPAPPALEAAALSARGSESPAISGTHVLHGRLVGGWLCSPRTTRER